MYSEIFLRLEPLGLERVAGAARDAGHDVRIVDLQVTGMKELAREFASFRPEALGMSLNYLAKIPEAIDLARTAKRAAPDCFVFFGGHSVSFVAGEVLAQAEGAVDAVVRGEGEPAVVSLLAAVRDGGVEGVPGIVTPAGRGPAPGMLHSIDSPIPARDLMRHRRRYFIGELDPCASIEFTPGLPVGLLLLLGMDLLRPQLPQSLSRGGRGGDGGNPGAERLHRRRRRLHPS